MISFEIMMKSPLIINILFVKYYYVRQIHSLTPPPPPYPSRGLYAVLHCVLSTVMIVFDLSVLHVVNTPYRWWVSSVLKVWLICSAHRPPPWWYALHVRENLHRTVYNKNAMRSDGLGQHTIVGQLASFTRECVLCILEKNLAKTACLLNGT